MTRQVHPIDASVLRRARRIATLTLASFAIGAPGLSQAQSPGPSAQQPSAADKAAADGFKRADSNQDGKLSREEAAHLPAIAAKFDALDKDKDGSLSLDEFMASYTK
jgi:hypothetical protein